MNINNDILDALDEYHERSLLMQKYLYEKQSNLQYDDLKKSVNDDLIFNVPIYDMLDRKYAAFSSFPEALKMKENDPKGHGLKYKNHKLKYGFDHFYLLYLFRLCGSGINYKPESHGFGNFWICDEILNGRYNYLDWLKNIPESRFSDNKGYLLPQFSIGLRNFIINYSFELITFLYESVERKKMNIIEFVDLGNRWMNNKGFKKTKFVLSAFAADVAEYYPNYIDQWSMIYAGTNAQKCIKLIFNKTSDCKAIDFLSQRYNAPPYSVEDSRLCDPIRYFNEFQSKYHIEKNNGIIFKNNTILKKIWTKSEYQNFLSRIQK